MNTESVKYNMEEDEKLYRIKAIHQNDGFYLDTPELSNSVIISSNVQKCFNDNLACNGWVMCNWRRLRSVENHTFYAVKLEEVDENGYGL